MINCAVNTSFLLNLTMMLADGLSSASHTLPELNQSKLIEGLVNLEWLKPIHTYISFHTSITQSEVLNNSKYFKVWHKAQMAGVWCGPSLHWPSSEHQPAWHHPVPAQRDTFIIPLLGSLWCCWLSPSLACYLDQNLFFLTRLTMSVFLFRIKICIIYSLRFSLVWDNLFCVLNGAKLKLWKLGWVGVQGQVKGSG